MLDRNPDISVVVPLQEHLCFDMTLKALAEQQDLPFSSYEVIAVDGLYLRDWPSVIAGIRRQYPNIQLNFIQIENTRCRARQLNIGLRAARAEIVLMLADDFIPCPRLLSLHLEAHGDQREEELVAIGPGLFPQDSRTNDFMSWLEDSGELFGVSFTAPGLQLPPQYFYMANTSLKRSFLRRAGEFDEDFPYDAMDDWEMGLRLAKLGMRNVYLQDAVAIHEHILDLPERCRAMRQAGETSAIYDAKHPRPGPWTSILAASKVPYSRRKRETREQRYKRILWDHWKDGYKAGSSKRGKAPVVNSKTAN